MLRTKSTRNPAADEPVMSYFSAQAYWGVTKHMGGVGATDELVRYCRVAPHYNILEVGCGVGRTTGYLAQQYGCRVVGIDLAPQMLAWATNRAIRMRVTDHVIFACADIQQLPFRDNRFDVVICESVLAFPPDKHKAIRECLRVVRPGGYIGLNEVTWVHDTPPDDVVEYVYRALAHAAFLTSSGWYTLLGDAGCIDIRMQVYPFNMLNQWMSEIDDMDVHDIRERIDAFRRFFSLCVRSDRFRDYAKTLVPSRHLIMSFLSHMGYGLYVGRKPYASMNTIKDTDHIS